jgi:hypothetical protein
LKNATLIRKKKKMAESRDEHLVAVDRTRRQNARAETRCAVIERQRIVVVRERDEANARLEAATSERDRLKKKVAKIPQLKALEQELALHKQLAKQYNELAENREHMVSEGREEEASS